MVWKKPGASPHKTRGDLSPESLGGASLRLRGFFLPILRRGIGLERSEQATGDAGYFIDCVQESVFVGLGRFAKAADFSHELQRSGPNLIVRDWRIEVEEGFDISAHAL
jgi:hypothetical protein